MIKAPVSWLQRDTAAVWHPFTQHGQWLDDEPLVVDRAEGPWIYDLDGNRYLDGVSSLWGTTFGHRTPEINRAITDQLAELDHFTFLGATHRPGIEWIRLLGDAVILMPPLALSDVEVEFLVEAVAAALEEVY